MTGRQVSWVASGTLHLSPGVATPRGRSHGRRGLFEHFTVISPPGHPDQACVVPPGLAERDADARAEAVLQSCLVAFCLAFHACGDGVEVLEIGRASCRERV